MNQRVAVRQVLKTRDLPRWISFPDFDRVDWLNSLMGSLWPHVTAAATNLVHEQLDPQLKVNKPRWIADISLSECAAPVVKSSVLCVRARDS